MNSASLSRDLLHVAMVATLAVGMVACEHAGADRVLAIDGSAVVNGVAYFDVNGTRQLEDDIDQRLGGVRVQLVVRGTRQAVASGVSDVAGSFTMSGLPPGEYVLNIDDATVGDTAQVVQIDGEQISLTPDGSVDVLVTISFPIVSVVEARSLAIGEKVFVQGVALTSRGAFGDTTVHIADTSAAMRLIRVRAAVFVGDSVRVRGTTAARDGQPTLDDVVPFVLAIASLITAMDVSTADAATAKGGSLDAALVRVADAVIGDTATVAGSFRLTVDDGSGALEVLLDEDVDIDLTPYIPNAIVDVTGVLVPSGSGSWALKPRSSSDLTVQ